MFSDGTPRSDGRLVYRSLLFFVLLVNNTKVIYTREQRKRQRHSTCMKYSIIIDGIFHLSVGRLGPVDVSREPSLVADVAKRLPVLLPGGLRFVRQVGVGHLRVVGLVQDNVSVGARSFGQ